jgi:hypothetical protein
VKRGETPFVGMGLTYRFKEQVYAGTVVRVSDDLQSIFFVQDRPHSQAPCSPKAFVFTPGSGQAYEATLGPEGYVWDGGLVVLGVRRWVTTPLTDAGTPSTGLAAFRERFSRLEPGLLQRKWYPMTYMLIPSLLRSADELIAEMGGYEGPDGDEVRELRATLVARRAGFRRGP